MGTWQRSRRTFEKEVELKELYRAGRCTRREFLRTATLLGISFARASAAGPSYRFPRQRSEDEVAARVVECGERISGELGFS